MRIPKSVSVLGKQYRVRLVNGGVDKKGSWGNAIHRTLEINVRKDTAPDEQAEIFLHELIHCAAVQTLAYPVREQTIYGISSALYAILKDNRLQFVAKKRTKRR